MRTVFLDTNVILRFLLRDHPTLSPAARELFAMAERDELQLFVDPVVLGECCFVLGGKAYTEEFPSKQEIADRLSRVLLLNGIVSYNLLELVETLEVYAQSNVDFADAHLAVLARNRECAVASFDRNFQHLDVDVIVPSTPQS
jgi:predicted nucleic acid-binding protein